MCKAGWRYLHPRGFIAFFLPKGVGWKGRGLNVWKGPEGQTAGCCVYLPKAGGGGRGGQIFMAQGPPEISISFSELQTSSWSIDHLIA